MPDESLRWVDARLQRPLSSSNGTTFRDEGSSRPSDRRGSRGILLLDPSVTATRVRAELVRQTIEPAVDGTAQASKKVQRWIRPNVAARSCGLEPST